MTAGIPFPLPGGRVLAGWRRDLAPLQPARFWLAQFLLHRVEALIRVPGSCPLDPLQAALLRRLDVPPDGTHLDRQVLGRLIQELARAGLVEQQGECWRLTGTGRDALDRGAYPRHEEERRTFTFRDAGPDRPPRWLHLLQPAGRPAEPPPGWRFDVGVLEDCVRRPAEWKVRHGFPEDVGAVVRPDAAAPDWRSVVLDHAELLTTAIVLSTASGAPRLVGFAVRPDGWAMGREPAVEAGDGWEDEFPELAATPPPEAWRAAWGAWCQRRGLPPAEADDCRLDLVGERLVVAAPSRLAARLRDGEEWLLAGEGVVRSAARVEVTEQAT
jgi:hypothetical protein